MTVGELEAILARLPEDMLVIVDGGAHGPNTAHVDLVETRRGRTLRFPTVQYCETGNCVIDRDGGEIVRKFPPAVFIGVRRWWNSSPRSYDLDAPEVEIAGTAHWRSTTRKPREVTA